MKHIPDLTSTQIEIMNAAMTLRANGIEEWFGFQVAKTINNIKSGCLLMPHGTLYRALNDLTNLGFLTARWEHQDIAIAEDRPRRKYYRLTQLRGTEVSDDTKNKPATA